MNNSTQLENLIKGALNYSEDKLDPSDASLEKSKILLGVNRKYGRKMLMNPILNRTTFVWFIIFTFVFLMTGGAIGASAATLLKGDKTNKIDKTDYPFVDDPRVIGKWESVDFVNSIGEYSPNKQFWADKLYLKEQVFMKGGEMLVSVSEGNEHLAPSPATWTKELLINKTEGTASKYKIIDINGSTYMFLEWKNGDYVFGGMQPKLYVLRKIDDADYSKVDIPRITDKTDYPFVNDPLVVGTWESVDFVRTIESFNPNIKSWLPDLFVTGLVFEGKGQMAMNTISTIGIMDAADPKYVQIWTKGIIISKYWQTASKYEIREISGSKYMFFEWKSGDYVYRGMQPWFYVLKKVD